MILTNPSATLLMIVLPAHFPIEFITYSGFIQLYAQRSDGLSVSKNWGFEQNFQKTGFPTDCLPVFKF
jgi:hypothetical protein